MITEKFHTRIDKYNSEKEKFNKTLNSISTARFMSFIVIVYLGYKYVKADYSYLFFIMTLVSIIVFVSFIIYHNKVKNKLNFTKSLIEINTRHLERINGDWINFPDNGEDFANKAHSYSNDLDIVGPNSLFQRLNIFKNWIGRNSLAKDLLNPDYDKEEILHRQNAIRELSSKLDFIQNLEYESSKNTKIKNPQDLIQYFKDNRESSYSKEKKVFLSLLPVFLLGIFAIAIYLKIRFIYILLLPLLLFQVIVWLIGVKKNDSILDEVGQYKNNLEVYLGLLNIIQKEDFQSPLLNSIKEDLFSRQGAIKAIKKLDMVSEKINLKHAGVIYLLLNIFLLWDYRCVFSLEDWNNKYGKDVEDWIHSIGKIQSLASLSVLLLIEENTSFPIIKDTQKIIANSCGHPLLQVEDRVYNSIDIENNILIITGSNMSGKTTFLRTIGINLVLLNAGTVTISREFKSPMMNVFTSMRVTDDLKNNISTFYAELLRIKEILDFAKDNNNTLFLIDEIFKGTNSKDRILGAKNVLMNLNKLGLIGAITTHDFELCELDKYPRIKNYHFAEDYIKGKISFDYKIKSGRSQSTNARYLMELVGIEFIDG